MAVEHQPTIDERVTIEQVDSLVRALDYGVESAKTLARLAVDLGGPPTWTEEIVFRVAVISLYKQTLPIGGILRGKLYLMRERSDFGQLSADLANMNDSVGLARYREGVCDDIRSGGSIETQWCFGESGGRWEEAGEAGPLRGRRPTIFALLGVGGLLLVLGSLVADATNVNVASWWFAVGGLVLGAGIVGMVRMGHERRRGSRHPQ